MEITNLEKEKLQNYVNFLLEYNNKINLIGKSTIEDIWNRHIVDSLQVIKLIENKNVKLADLGSGAGLPGIVLSICGIKEVHLFEKSPRKCEFLEKAKVFSDNKIVIQNVDISIFKDKTFDIITSRALGNLNLLLNFSLNLKKDNTKCIFLKGKKVFEELDEAKKIWNIDYELIDSITSNEGKIVKISSFYKK
ncbi:MAG TPA: 16S rRNA (guanine(527)-N(7))-methyltransferase RsmG [Rickettsiales bacterium]|nr:16S rRNA (guanine(527)-N(7))-methyltransferase RsmG [Rickettsiales bacterium]